jgi:hypothetical protein
MRKEKDFKVEEEGRDKNKLFHITEMPAVQAERWAIRAFLALARSGVDVPDNIMQAGMAGFAVLGFQALMGLQYESIEPLLNELMDCVQIIPDPKNRESARPLIDDDIEEVSTLLLLKMEVFQIHVGFSMADAKSRLTQSA